MPPVPNKRLMGVALFLAALNMRPAINSVGPLLETLRTRTGMSAAVASLLTAVPVLCMGVFSPLAARMGRQVGLERMTAVALGLVAAGTALRVWANSAGMLIGTALVAGMGIAALGPLLAGFIKRHFPDRVPTMISVYTVSLTLGAAFASGLSMRLLHWFGTPGLALAAWAGVAIAALPAWWAWAMRGADMPAATASTAPLPWRQPTAWLLVLSFGLMSTLFYCATAWLPSIMQDLGYDRAFGANALVVFVAVQIPVSLLMPVALKRVPSRLVWLFAAGLVQLAGLALLALGVVPLGAAVLMGVGVSALFSLNLLLPMDVTGDAYEAAAWTAMVQGVGYVISATGPLLLGWAHDQTGSFWLPRLGLVGVNLAMLGVHLLLAPRLRPRG